MAPVFPASLPLSSMGAAMPSPAANLGNLAHGGNASFAPTHGAPSTLGGQLPPHVEAFYTAAPEAPSFNNHVTPPSVLDTPNMFSEATKFLQNKSSGAAGLLQAQAEVIQVTLGWSVMGQLASKASSSLQTFLNNQV